MFEDFDFSLLESPSFKEDSVREELILPILKRLGYSASPPNQICRGIKLQHPYVCIGTQKKKIHIFPDYVIKRNDKNFFVLDAKSPTEEILNGKSVEQAYSYAIHRDVRTSLFALCNGKMFALFDISHYEAILHCDLREIEHHWKQLATIMGSDAVRRQETFRPDLGLTILRLGFGLTRDLKKIHQVYLPIDFHLVARVNETTYSIQSYIEYEGVIFLGTFDFSKELLQDFIQSIDPLPARQEIEKAIVAYPFVWRRTGPISGVTGLACTVADNVLTSKDEQYLPFQVEKFFEADYFSAFESAFENVNSITLRSQFRLSTLRGPTIGPIH